MKITVKAGDVEICVELDITPPHPSQHWYGINMPAFAESIKECLDKSAEKVLLIQNNRYASPNPPQIPDGVPTGVEVVLL